MGSGGRFFEVSQTDGDVPGIVVAAGKGGECDAFGGDGGEIGFGEVEEACSVKESDAAEMIRLGVKDAAVAEFSG